MVTFKGDGKTYAYALWQPVATHAPLQGWRTVRAFLAEAEAQSGRGAWRLQSELTHVGQGCL